MQRKVRKIVPKERHRSTEQLKSIADDFEGVVIELLKFDGVDASFAAWRCHFRMKDEQAAHIFQKAVAVALGWYPDGVGEEYVGFVGAGVLVTTQAVTNIGSGDYFLEDLEFDVRLSNAPGFLYKYFL